MARKSKATKNNEILAEALKLFDQSVSADDANRILCREDRRFSQVSGEQWDQRFNTDKSKPRFEVNRIHHAISQVVGEYSRNQITSKVRPATGDGTTDIANTYNGIIRNVYAKSHFNYLQNEAFQEVCHTGFACWRILNEYIDEHSFEQDIKIELIRDAINCVWFDSTDKSSLKSDSRYCFITTDVDRDVFKEMYPDASINSWEKMSDTDLIIGQGWANSDTVRVAEYYKKTEKTRTVVKLSDGRIVPEADLEDIFDELSQAGIEIIEARKVKYDEITWQKLSGTDVLEGPIVLDCKNIPVIPIYGYSTWIDQNHVFYGMVRPAKDSQRLYNYAVSAAVEAAANSPLDPIFITPDMAAGYEDQYRNANVRNTPFLFYNPEESGQLPVRIGAPVVQQALIEQAGRAERDIQATLGRNDAALGEIPRSGNAIASGVALQGAQKQANLGQETLFQNMGNAVEYTGELLVGIIPKVYSGEQQMRILNQDGNTEFVPVNQEVQDVQTGETVMFNDLNQGKYDVTVTLSPSFDSQRQETIAMLTALSAENPAFMAATADILAKSMDFPEAEEISKRVRKQMIAQGIIEPNEEEQKEMAEKEANTPPDPVSEIEFKKLQLELETQAANVDYLESQSIKTRADAQKVLADAEKSEITATTALLDSMTKQFEAGIKATQEQMNLLQQQIAENQTSIIDKISPQVDEAFVRMAPGIYETDTGQIIEVDQDGNMGQQGGNQ